MITTFNWVVGTVFLVAAFLSNPILGNVYVDNNKKACKKLVEDIARAEKQAYEANQRYVLFGPSKDRMAEGLEKLNMKILRDDFAVEAFYEEATDGNRNLVIRGSTRIEAIQAYRLPAIIYRYVIPADGSDPSGNFVQLSGKSYGLALF